MSTTTPCPECKGFCCVNKYGSPAEHGAALALHSCPDCDDGTYGVRSEPEPAPQPVRTYEDGVATATARIVAWLRQEADAAMEIRFARRAGDFAYAADAIERGEHVTEVKP